jgi:succinate dehydrogenase/fumarate reductase flavoprotein subunit
MWDNAGIFRNEQGLNAALKFITEEQVQVASSVAARNKAKRYNNEWISALELQDMLLVSEMLVRSAVLRKESRGAHFRTDYPTTNNNEWFANIMIKQRASRMILEKVPVVVSKWLPPWMEKQAKEAH